MHSHHSHSGDYVAHASGTLDGMVRAAEERGFVQYCLTEHMPRLNDAYLYPEEIEGNISCEKLSEIFDKYLIHARSLQKTSQMHILVGYEVEGVDTEHIKAAEQIRPKFDMCVGSVHHVHGIPIDFDSGKWLMAREKSGSTRQLYKDYYDLQYEVLVRLKPDVVGHFDLIRLFDLRSEGNGSWPDVAAAISRNIDLVILYGGLFELNSAAIRKGWTSPYPQEDIVKEIIRKGGRFCLSDDAHAYSQVGLNYEKMWAFVQRMGIRTIHHLEIVHGALEVIGESVDELSKLRFWGLMKPGRDL